MDDDSASKKEAGLLSRRAVIIYAQAIAAIVIIALIARGFWATGSGQGATTTAPEQIAGLKLVKLLSGQEAVADMSRLHGKDVGLTGGWVGYYEAKAIIWNGETQTEAQAYQLTEAMTRRIAAGNEVFTDLQQTRIDSTVVFSVVGMGQKHYYFQRGNKVVWIAAPNIAGEEFLRQAMAAVK